MKKKIVAVLAAVGIALGAAACSSEADTVSYNLSKSADNFEVLRRIVFINGITDKYLLEIQGLCALGNNDKPRELTVVCKVGPDEYMKHFLGLSDNVTYLLQQISPKKVNAFHYKVFFRPETLIPDIDLQTSIGNNPQGPYTVVTPTPTGTPTETLTTTK